MTMSTPAALWLQCVLDRPGQRGHQHSVVVHLRDDVVGRRAERVGDQLDLRVVEDAPRPAAPPWPPSSRAVSRRGPPSSSGTPWSARIFLAKVRCSLGDHRPQLGLELDRVDLVHALVLARDDDVDAVGLVADVLVEPRQLDLELARR